MGALVGNTIQKHNTLYSCKKIKKVPSDPNMSFGVRPNNEMCTNNYIKMSKNIHFDFWACQRPLTHRWGSGQVFERILKSLGKIDVVFGKTDGIPDGVLAIDHNTGYEWTNLPFPDNCFSFGYWDPPYDKLYKKEGQEIWRTVRRLAILHTHIWPIAWLKNAKREAMIAVTMGPMKQIRCLQVFLKSLEAAP